MRLLPRSARGTWLLAAVMWPGLSAVGWCLTPPMPRGVAWLPDLSRHTLIGFGPDCATALVLRTLPPEPGWTSDVHSLVMLDTATGESVATLINRTRGVEVLGRSRDGNTWLLSDTYQYDARLVQLDLANRTVYPLPVSSVAADQGWQDRLSADGRFAAICCPPMGLSSRDPTVKGLLLWDATAKKQRAFFSGLDSPYEFSTDGRWLTAAITGQATRCIGVVNLETLQIRETRIPASNMPFDRGCLSDDGSHLAQYLLLGDGRDVGGNDFKTICWDVSTGKEVFQFGGTPFGRLAFTHNGRYLLLPSYLQSYDLADRGRRVYRFADDHHTTGADISPDGRFLLVMKRAPSPLPWRWLIRKLGVKWNLGRDAECYGEIFDTATWSSQGIIPGKSPSACSANRSSPALDVGWGPDGKTLAAQDATDADRWYIWDISPRKPLVWFAIAAVILALPFAWLARRRVRRLRSNG